MRTTYCLVLESSYVGLSIDSIILHMIPCAINNGQQPDRASDFGNLYLPANMSRASGEIGKHG